MFDHIYPLAAHFVNWNYLIGTEWREISLNLSSNWKSHKKGMFMSLFGSFLYPVIKSVFIPCDHLSLKLPILMKFRIDDCYMYDLTYFKYDVPITLVVFYLWGKKWRVKSWNKMWSKVLIKMPIYQIGCFYWLFMLWVAYFQIYKSIRCFILLWALMGDIHWFCDSFLL